MCFLCVFEMLMLIYFFPADLFLLIFRQIESQYTNLFNIFFPTPNKSLAKKLDKWFTKQRLWADDMISRNGDSPLWRHVSYILAQLDGLYAGYKSVQDTNKVILLIHQILFFVSLLYI